MLRRQYLASVTALSSLGLAGCSDSDEESEDTPEADTEADDSDTETESTDEPTEKPTEEPTEVETDEPTEEDQYDVSPFTDDLEADEIDVDYAAVESDSLTLDFITEASSTEELDSDASTIAHAYANHVSEFDDLDALESWALDEEFEFVGAFSVDTDWAESYESGDLSEAEYLEQVHETIE